ncbi:MAG TPA: AmmeMemoRadiSam system radical SAM enzyme [Patescibacteria group bacterium]|nr:AmmeMemoRadiSam system radical SAM enzyme [Patescibacteria group bacterium]
MSAQKESGFDGRALQGTDRREAAYYDRILPKVRCRLCPRQCEIGEGHTGFCRVRRNRGGILWAETYGHCSSHALDPIEKKPLYHFYPGGDILSLGSLGCNLACLFCQNWQISQREAPTVSMTPVEAVALAHQAGANNLGIAYTYSEPGVWFEFVLDTARQINAAGLKNVLVTNGWLEREPLLELLPCMDAMNIDVKAFSEEFYQRQCGGRLADVLATVEMAAAQCHVEVTTLLIPGLNDDSDQVTRLARWLSQISSDIPLHFSRYFPNYRMNLPPTAPETLRRAHDDARQYLNYVYLGNLGGEGSGTNCPACGREVINRQKRQSALTEGNRCSGCGATIALTGRLLGDYL